ncbi:MAG TPA: D-alanyl-D-alanine carboxypeptidase, partial [Bacteroidales bacterium]|nr:D-alanyl-D-alanine carboxypeptidase [Bacteroidales bacterium]
MYRKISYIFLNIYLFLGFVNYAYSQDKNNTSTIAINNKLELMKNTPQLKNATWGFCAIDCTTGNTIAEYNSNIGLVPASILKIVTTTASLYILGSDFKFLTKLQYTGHINEEGVLNGNLYITGGGDPTLCSDFLPNTIEDSIFYKFYLALLSSNIKQINGNIIGDESIFNWE